MHPNDTMKAADVLDFIDTFAGQENTAEEVRDFVQLAARFIEQQRPAHEWEEDPKLFAFYEWCVENKTEDSDLAIAIGEHAFRAGYNVGYDDGYGNGGAPKYHAATGVERAWSDYTPPDELCGKAL